MCCACVCECQFPIFNAKHPQCSLATPLNAMQLAVALATSGALLALTVALWHRREAVAVAREERRAARAARRAASSKRTMQWPRQDPAPEQLRAYRAERQREKRRAKSKRHIWVPLRANDADSLTPTPPASAGGLIAATLPTPQAAAAVASVPVSSAAVDPASAAGFMMFQYCTACRW